MVNGFSKWLGLVLLSVISFQYSVAQNQVKATALQHDIKDLSQRSTKVYDQNGERCAVIKFETPIPSFFTFNLGAQQIEKRENKDDEVWIWVSPDVKKMTIRCSECTPLKDYRVSLKSGNVYRAKLTTGLPQEVATTQKVNFYSEHIPFFISIDGAEPVENKAHTYYTELPIGAHQVMVAAKFYKPYNATFRVYRSKPYMDTVRMEDNYGEIALTATQSAYTAYLDGELQKQNRLIKAEPGEHKLVISKDRYETYEVQVEVKLKEQTPVHAVLKPAFAMFAIDAAEDETEIWVDDKYRGRKKANVELVWGVHKVEGRRKGYDTWEYPIQDFNANSEKSIKIPKLNKQYGSIRLAIFPPHAQAYVDGKLVNSNDGVYNDPRVPTGPHFVQIRLTDYRTIRDTFTVESGQVYARNYELEAIPLGEATIQTEQDIAIYRRVAEDNTPIYLGHTQYTGKLPAGENIIELKSTTGVTCQYHVFINEKATHSFTLPFKRKLMIRTNVSGGKLMMSTPYTKQPYRIKANKKINSNPLKYVLDITKKGYQPYHDTIDLTVPGTKYTVYRAELRKENDTVAHEKRYQSPAFLQRYYDNAGTWFIGIVDFGYTFDFNGGLDPKGFRHLIHFGVLPIRYRMLGINPADFEICVNDSAFKQTFTYRPKISLVVPCKPGFAFTFYGGVGVNIYQKFMAKEKPVDGIHTDIFGGVTMRMNKAGCFPVDIFAEYKYPIKGVDASQIGNKSQLFRVGLTFMLGVDR